MSRTRSLIVAAAVVLILLGGLAYEIVATRPVRGALRDLLRAASRPPIGPTSGRTNGSRRRGRSARGDISARTSSTSPQDGQGLVGIPRNLNKNFKAWREGPNVWICPTNRVGPVYQFVLEDGTWRFDGPVGILRPWAEIVPMDDVPEVE